MGYQKEKNDVLIGHTIMWNASFELEIVFQTPHVRGHRLVVLD